MKQKLSEGFDTCRIAVGMGCLACSVGIDGDPNPVLSVWLNRVGALVLPVFDGNRTANRDFAISHAPISTTGMFICAG